MKLEKLDGSIYSSSRIENISHSENSRFFNLFYNNILSLVLIFFNFERNI